MSPANFNLCLFLLGFMLCQELTQGLTRSCQTVNGVRTCTETTASGTRTCTTIGGQETCAGSTGDSSAGSDTSGLSPGDSSAGSDTSGLSPVILFQEVVQLFRNHECVNVPTNCADDYGVDFTDSALTVNCGTVKKVGQCMFDKCPAISGSKDENEAANKLVKYAKTFLSCDFTAGELTNGGVGVVQIPVWGSLTFVLAAALVKTLLV